MTRAPFSRTGSAAVSLIVTLTVLSAFTAAILSVNTTAEYTSVGYNSANQAYYLAESGGRFVLSQRIVGPSSETLYYRLSDGKRFELFIRPSGDAEVTGVLNPGTPLEAARRLIFRNSHADGMPFTDQAIGYWSFDDHLQPAKDDLGNWDGTVYDAQWEADGRFNGALSFSGNEWVELDTDEGTPFQPDKVLSNEGPFTVVLWARPASAHSQTLLGAQDGKGRFALGIDSGKWTWAMPDSQAQTDLTAATDAWQHLALVYQVDDTTVPKKERITVYRNGRESDLFESELDPLAGFPEATLFIGAENIGESPHDNYQGWIDELAIFNVALSQCQIRAIYEMPPGPGYEAVAYYPLDAATADQSGADGAGKAINKATAEGTIAWPADRFDCVGRAFGLNGTDTFLRVEANDWLDLSDSGTIGAWIYVESFQELAGIIHKGDQGNHSDQAYSLQFWKQPDGKGKQRVTLILNDGSADPPQLISRPLDEALLQENQWYHVMGTWDAGAMARLYIDGELHDSQSLSPGFKVRNSPGALNMGRKPAQNGTGYWMHGRIDAIVLFDEALSADRIQKIAIDRPQ